MPSEKVIIIHAGRSYRLSENEYTIKTAGGTTSISVYPNVTVDVDGVERLISELADLQIGVSITTPAKLPTPQRVELTVAVNKPWYRRFVK